MTQEFPSIALLTDFGLQDTYVGVMKGVMLDICPEARLIDLTHAIRPQDVRQAALALLDSYRYLPRRTVFLVVVDPGVGSTRRAIAVDAGPYWFVGPDNGVLSYALREIGEWEAFELTNDRYWLPDSSNTFHGRDIFAPVAAHIAYGSSVKPFSLGELGTPIDDPVLLPPPLLVTTGVIDSLNTNPFDGRMQNLAVFAFNEYRSPGVPPEPSIDRAWAAALTLIVIVMALNLVGRWVYRRFGTEIPR